MPDHTAGVGAASAAVDDGPGAALVAPLQTWTETCRVVGGRPIERRVGTAAVELSVVVPAYRIGSAIGPSLDRLTTALDRSGITWEVVVVADGDEETWAHAAERASERVRVYGYRGNRGKGFALRYGILKARGEVITFIDADMDIAPEEIGRMVRLLELYDAHVVVGSKRHPLSQVAYPRLRRVQSWAYQVLIRLLFRLRVRDTQTGLKVLRRDVAERVVALALVKRFAFDLELLVIAHRLGYRRIIEAPIRLEHRFPSTTDLRAVRDVLLDTAAIWYRLRLRHWYDRPQERGMVDVLEAD